MDRGILICRARPRAVQVGSAMFPSKADKNNLDLKVKLEVAHRSHNLTFRRVTGVQFKQASASSSSKRLTAAFTSRPS
jgi:hypothetical protein